MIGECTNMPEPKLFGQPKYEVESAADTLSRANELESTKPEIYAAAIKLLKKRQIAISAVLRASAAKRKCNG
jgi:hypothetical protein